MRILVFLMLAGSCGGLLEAQDKEGPQFPVVHVIEGHGEDVPQVAFSKFGQFLATASRDGKVRVYKTKDWKVHVVLAGNGTPLEAVTFSPDSRTLLAAGEFVVRMWKVEKAVGKPWAEIRDLVVNGPEGVANGRVTDLCFHAKGRSLIAATYGGTVQFWSTKDWFIQAPLGPHEGLGFDPPLLKFARLARNGKLIVSGGETPETRVWKLTSVGARKEWLVTKSFKERLVGETYSEHRTVACFSPDSKLLALGGTDGVLSVYATSTWKKVADEHAHPAEPIGGMVFSPDSKKLFTGAEDLKVWDTSKWEFDAMPPGEAGIRFLCCSRNGKLLAEVGTDHQIRIRDVAAKKKRKRKSAKPRKTE